VKKTLLLRTRQHVLSHVSHMSCLAAFVYNSLLFRCYNVTRLRPLPFTPDLKLISFTNPFFHSHSYSFRTDFTDLNLHSIKGALLCLFQFLATCARLSCILSFWVHVKLFYRIVSYRVVVSSRVEIFEAKTLALASGPTSCPCKRQSQLVGVYNVIWNSHYVPY